MTNEQLQAVKQLIINAQKANHFIKVTFIKKNGEVRPMLCHRAKVLEETVKEVPDAATLKRKATNAVRNNLCVEELKEGKHQFRTINLNTVIEVAAGGQVLKFN